MISPRLLALALTLTVPLISSCTSRKGEACRCADDCDSGLECVAPIGLVSACLHPADAGGVCVEKGIRVVLPDDLGETGQIDDQIIDDWLPEFDSGVGSSVSSGSTTDPGDESSAGTDSATSGSSSADGSTGTAGDTATSGDLTGDLESSEAADASAGSTAESADAEASDGAAETSGEDSEAEEAEEDATDESESSGW